MSTRALRIALILFWMTSAGAYLWVAANQKLDLNLSATAGGQYPYLINAQRMSEEGVTQYFGDRNRMPLYPALLSTVYVEDWDAFVSRSAWFAIFSSMLMLSGVGLIAYRCLPVGPATAFTVVATFCVFRDRASFVQAELLYFALIFASWVLMCRLLRKPGIFGGIGAGVLLATAYLTKASALAALLAYLVTAGALLLVSRLSLRHRAKPSVPPLSRSRVVTAAVVALTFLAVVFPYINENKARFDRYFYNVNSSFFLWTDGWVQAKAFADRYHVFERYPSAPPSEIPGPMNYWQTHTMQQIGHRLNAGLRTVGTLAMARPSFKYVAIALAFCVLLGVGQTRRLRKIGPENWSIVGFSLLLGMTYVVVYGWYAQVAYGDRFVLSLALPALFAGLWLASNLSKHTKRYVFFGRSFSKVDGLTAVLLLGVLVETAVLTAGQDAAPSSEFVQFYYNESHERLLEGDRLEAGKGFKGVLRLDPSFAPAHRALGHLSLTAGRFDEAVDHLTDAVQLDPASADAQNSLGSALRQLGRTQAASERYLEAIRLDPDFAAAWFNLGGAFWELGAAHEASAVLEHLETLDPALARSLAAAMAE